MLSLFFIEKILAPFSPVLRSVHCCVSALLWGRACAWCSWSCINHTKCLHRKWKLSCMCCKRSCDLVAQVALLTGSSASPQEQCPFSAPLLNGAGQAERQDYQSSSVQDQFGIYKCVGSCFQLHYWPKRRITVFFMLPFSLVLSWLSFDHLSSMGAVKGLSPPSLTC